MINIDLQKPNVFYPLAAALTSLIILTFFINVWQWRSDWQLIHRVSAAPAQVPVDQTTQLIHNLPNAHLFGQAFMRTDGMPITNLQLRLTGIVKVNNEQGVEVSKAYISISGQTAKIYEVGDTLPYGVKVYSITQDSVVLDNDGHLEKLPLPREKLQFKPIEKEENF